MLVELIVIHIQLYGHGMHLNLISQITMTIGTKLTGSLDKKLKEALVVVPLLVIPWY